MSKILLVHVRSIWFGGIGTFWDRKLLVKSLYNSKSLWILSIFFVRFFWPKMSRYPTTIYYWKLYRFIKSEVCISLEDRFLKQLFTSWVTSWVSRINVDLLVFKCSLALQFKIFHSNYKKDKLWAKTWCWKQKMPLYSRKRQSKHFQNYSGTIFQCMNI